MSIAVTSLILAGLESANLLMKRLPDYDQQKAEIFEVLHAIYYKQKTLPTDHPDRNDALLLRIRHLLQNTVEEINKLAASDAKAQKSLPT